MVLEVLLAGGFTTVLDWLAKGELRDQMSALEKAAGRPATNSLPRPRESRSTR